jgi:hypothetical protein
MPSIRLRKLALLAPVLVVLTMPGSLRADSIFNFDSAPITTTSPFSQTVNGLTATFSSPADPGGFAVSSASFLASPFSGNVLVGTNQAGVVPLTIGLSQNVDSVSLDFATETTATFLLTAFENGTQVGQATAVGSVPSGFLFPQGSLDLNNGELFDSVTLSSLSPDFAIDNVDFGLPTGPTPVPEPSSLVLIGSGLSILLLLFARSRQGLIPNRN